MQRRLFLQRSLVCAGLLTLPAASWAGLFPPDPFLAQAFPDLQDQDRTLSSYAGKPLVINFWATWCAPCVKEMPDLQALHQRYPEVNFVGIAVDSKDNVREFLQRVPVSYDILLSGPGGVKQMRSLGNKKGGLPFTVVFGSNGRVSERILGQIDPQKLDEVIKRQR
ncbi:MAG TPA: TlpA disulfide reductase family protein [Alcaligenes sp.]|nr:TlpA disulfide reductase family protein [Alcaligenes sp.]HRL28043.1 TlpA disulfide reductase family protein [Alcaligenes sp.]